MINIQIIIFVINILLCSCLSTDHFCLPQNERIGWVREFYFKNKLSPIRIEVSPRPSHRIVSYIIKILLQERLGYKNVVFNEVPWDSIDKVIGRLNCSSHKCQMGNPSSHINMEVWMGPGFSFDDYTKQNIIDCGPLGPTARKGIFIDRDQYSENHFLNQWKTYKYGSKVNNISYDKTIGFQNTIFQLRNELFTNSRIEQIENNMISEIIKSADPKPILLNWYPNDITVHANYTRVLYPDCWDSQIYCEFEANQLAKMVWSYINIHDKDAFDLINDFQLDQNEYVQLLKSVNLTAVNQEKEYYQVACNWLKDENNVHWKSWTTNWNKKYKLYLPILISDYGPWKSNETDLDAKLCIKKLNEIFLRQNHVVIEPIIRILPCDEDRVLYEYLSLSKEYDKRIIGFVGCLCPRTYDTVVQIADIENRLFISSLEFSNSNKNFTPHFFSTFPNMRIYNLILIKIFVHFNWKRVVVLKKDDFILNWQEFRRANIEILGVFEKKETEVTYNNSYFFLKKAKEQFKAGIYLVDYLSDSNVATIMCAAGNLKMTLYTGYVFILNPFISSRWNKNITVQECKHNHRLMSQEYFMIRHDFVSEHRELYYRSKAYKNMLSLLTNDAIFNLGLAFIKLYKKVPSVHLGVNNPLVSKELIKLLVNESQLILGQKSKYHRHIFDILHERTGIWQMIQSIFFKQNMHIALSIYKWDSNDKLSKPMSAKKYLTKINWGKSKTPLKDTIETSDCLVESIRETMGVSCTSAIISMYLIVVFSVIAILALLLLLFYKRQRTSKPEDIHKKPFEDLCAELMNIDIKSSDVVINMQVGKGAFGVVFGGEAKCNNRWESVAIKLIQKEVDYQGKIDFLTEAKLMRNLEHTNIVKLIGICLNPPKPVIYLVMELVVNGDLEDYLLSNRITARNDPDNKAVCPQKLTGFVRDIACGAHYLHKNNLLHRDLACRNCFLSEDDVVKIGDFGLTRLIDESRESQYYKVSRHFVLPARWMPPEAVEIGYFSVRSDIWSLGVVIFEISTFCSRPYCNISDDEVPEHVKNNIRSLKGYLPPHAKDSYVYKLIDKCCKYKLQDRYETMDDIVQELDKNPEGIRVYLTDDPPNANTINMLSKMHRHSENMHSVNQMKSLIGTTFSNALNQSSQPSGFSRTKSISRSKIESIDQGIPYFDSINNFSIMDDDTRRAFYDATEPHPNSTSTQDNVGSKRNDNPYCSRSVRSKKKHQNRSGSKKSRSNLNSSKSRSSDLTMNRLDDDHEHSYASCPDNQPITTIDIDPQDFTDALYCRLKSTSGGSNIYNQVGSSKKKQPQMFSNGIYNSSIMGLHSGSYRHKRNQPYQSSSFKSRSKSFYNHHSQQQPTSQDLSRGNADVMEPLLINRNTTIQIAPEKI